MKKVLIIDDDEYTLNHWGNLIRKMGCNVLIAPTGEKGVNVVREEKPDIIFLDLVLPDIDGETVFKRVKEINNEIKIYIVSGNTVAMTAVKAHDVGADGYITKPLMLEDLKRILEKEGVWKNG